MSDDNIQVRFGGETSGFQSAADSVKGGLSSIGESTQDLMGNLTALAAGFSAVFAVDRIAEFAEEMAGIGQQMERMSAQTGLPVAQVEEFQDTVKTLGGDAQNAGLSLMRLERNISEAAANASGPAADAFRRLGVSQADLAKGDLNEILAKMADRMSQTADGANKLGAMMTVAGRGGMSLIPVLDQGRAGLDELHEALDETGPSIAKLAPQFDQSAQGMSLLSTAQEKLGAYMYATLEPALDAAVNLFTRMTASMTDGISKGSAFTEIMRGFGDVIDGVTAAVSFLVTGIEQFADIAVGVFNAVVDGAEGVWKVMQDLAHANFAQAVIDYGTAQAKTFDDIKKGWQDAGVAGAKYWDDMTHMMQVYQGEAKVGTGAGGPSQGKQKIEAPQEKGDDTDKTAQILEKQRELYSEDYDNKKEMDELKVASGAMTNTQMLDDLKATLDQEHNLIDASFDQQIALYDSDSQEYQLAILAKQQADQKYMVEKTKLDVLTAKESEKTWDTAFDTIEHSFDKMLSGVLQGTQTIGQAFKRMAGDLIITMIEACAKMLLEWLKKEAMQTAATITGNAARATADTAGAAASTAATTTAASSTISKDASTAAAGVYSSVAQIPYVGWILAPVAAATAFGAVMAFDSFDVGTPNVPHDMIAQIHQGEAIIPRRQAQAWRDGDLNLGKGGGDSHTHFHISAMDGADVAKTLKRHGPAISAAVKSAARGGNASLRSAIR